MGWGVLTWDGAPGAMTQDKKQYGSLGWIPAACSPGRGPGDQRARIPRILYEGNTHLRVQSAHPHRPHQHTAPWTRVGGQASLPDANSYTNSETQHDWTFLFVSLSPAPATPAS